MYFFPLPSSPPLSIFFNCLLYYSLLLQLTMSAARSSGPPTTETQQRLAQALEPYITEWTNSLTGREVDLINRLPSSEVSAMLTIWLADKVALYSTQWKTEWQKRQVAEAAVREVAKSLEKAEAKLEAAENSVCALRRALEEAERRETRLRREREQGFLKWVVGGMKWEHGADAESGVGHAVGL